MSYIAKPGSMVAHIYYRSSSRIIGGVETPALEALCPAFFPNPQTTSYFVGTLAASRHRRRVCRHCAAIAHRKALALLRDAAGDRP